MPYADRERQLLAMKNWRAANPDFRKEYERTHVKTRSDAYLQRKAVRRREVYKANRGSAQFVGVDGEGMGDGMGHNYYTLSAGSDLLRTYQPLRSKECLDFIAGQPHGPVYVIYSGNYDFTMWLRDGPRDFVQDLLNRRGRMVNERVVRPSRWADLRVDYLPHKRLSVRRDDGPAIVVHDVFGFFQTAFCNRDPVTGELYGALVDWNIGTPEQRDIILRGKERRGNTDVLSDEDDEYNDLEVRLLSELMHKLDDTVKRVMLKASPYEGAGAIASSLYDMYVAKPVKERNRVAKRAGRELEPIAPPDYAHIIPSWDAYYGGRFEITAHGPVPGPVYEWDVNSAYPAAISRLPCLRHGRWTHDNAGTGIRLGFVRWRTDGVLLGPLPHRNKQGNVTFPLAGSGWYWSVEWPETDYEVLDCWSWIQSCDCRPYAWVEQIYQARKAHKAAGRIGEATALKLGYNSLYGKMAQNVGVASWRNSILAGLTTATCRRWVRDAAYQAPKETVMIATDGVYTTVPIDVPVGDGLGEWESHVFPDGLHLVRPGIYFTPDGRLKVKTRGIAKRAVQDASAQLIQRFHDVRQHPEWLLDPMSDDKEWGLSIQHTGMISLKLAYSQNRPERAGYVGLLPHHMSYSISPKRIPYSTNNFDDNWIDGVLRSRPPVMGIPFESVGYHKAPKPAHDEEDAMMSAPEGPPAKQQLELF